MSHSVTLKQTACEALFHYHSLRGLSKELNVSCSTLEAWRNFVENGDLRWVTERYTSHRRKTLSTAAEYWLEHYPVSYNAVARKFGIRVSELFIYLRERCAHPLAAELPVKLRLWKQINPPQKRDGTMDPKHLKKLLSSCKTEAQREKMYSDILICYEALMDEVLKDCKDDIKKKELILYRQQLREASAYQESVASSKLAEARTTTPKKKRKKS